MNEPASQGPAQGASSEPGEGTGSPNERGPEGTRREFLVSLAKASAYVAPLIVTLRGTPLGAGGKGSAAAAVFGGLSPSASLQSMEAPSFQIQEPGAASTAPWDAAPPPAPWSQPAPGREEEEEEEEE